MQKNVKKWLFLMKNIISKPQILYKYRSLAEDKFEFTRNIFINNKLYFVCPDKFNDPFDCNIFPCVKNITKKQILKEIEEKRDNLLARGIDILKLKQNVYNKSIEELRTYFLNEYPLHKNVGVLSLSEDNLDILMWGHYADSHKGICIGFDYSKLIFLTKEKLIPRKVNYPPDNKYPGWNPFSSSGEELVKKRLLTKALNWEYEQEWRVIFPEEGDLSQEFNPNALISVYLGCRITEENKKTVIGWCLQRKQKPKIYETKVDESSYSLKDNEIIYF